MKIKILILFFISISLTNCDLLTPDPDGKIEVSGIVINESTGNTIPNLSLVLEKGTGGGGLGSWGGYIIVDSAKTDQNGIFKLKYDAQDYKSSLQVYINREPYSDKYSTFNFSVMPGDNIDKVFNIYQNTILTVIMRSENPVNKREYTLWLPGIGTSVDTMLTTYRAKGNFINTVRLVYNRDGEHKEIIDSVYCPIDTTTKFILSY